MRPSQPGLRQPRSQTCSPAARMHCWAAAGSGPGQLLVWLLCRAAPAAGRVSPSQHSPCAAGHRTQLSSTAGESALSCTSDVRHCKATQQPVLLGRKAPNQLSCSTVHNNTLSHRWMGLGDCAGVRWVWAGSSPALTQHPACCLTCSLWVAAERRGPGRCPAPSPAGGAPVSCLRAKSSLQPLGKGGSGCRAR